MAQRNDEVRELMLRTRRNLQNRRTGYTIEKVEKEDKYGKTVTVDVLREHFTPVQASPRLSKRGMPRPTWLTKKHTKHRLKMKKEYEDRMVELAKKLSTETVEPVSNDTVLTFNTES